MTWHDDIDNEMSIFQSRTRMDIRAADALLSGFCKPDELTAGMRPVADVLSALQAPPARREIVGWGDALSLYRETVGNVRPISHQVTRRRGPGTSLLSAKLAVVAGIAVAALLGGGVTAAYTGVLPATLQKFAHDTIAAPGVHPGTAHSAGASFSHGAGPSATSSAAFGLCNAYQHAQQHGDSAEQAVAFRNLVKAAGGAGKVAAFCASVPHPGAGSHPGRPAPPGHAKVPSGRARGHNKPTASPSQGENGNGPGNSSPHGKSQK